MNKRFLDVLKTTDRFGGLMPSYLNTPVVDEMKKEGLVEDHLERAPVGIPWQRLTAKGITAKEDANRLVFHHDTDGLGYISAFKAALAPFGLYIEDVTPDNGTTVEVIVRASKPEKEWAY